MIKQLISDNKFNELKDYLNAESNRFGIHKVLFQIINDQSITLDSETFDADKYQEEFLEGSEIYKYLEQSQFPEAKLKEYIKALSFLSYQMGSFIKLLADRTMQDGICLSQIDAYKIDPTLRKEIQSFVDLLKKRNEIKTIANVAAAKAQITLSIADTLEKYEIGEDMLQFAISYEQAGQIEQAVHLYQGIFNDFECESIKLSSSMFPEIKHVDTHTTKEIEIYETAKHRYEAITGIILSTRPTIHKDADEIAKQLYEQCQSYKHKNEQDIQNENTGIISRLKTWFKKKS